MIIGIDPSIRHTGICHNDESGGQPEFYEIKTKNLSIVEATSHIQDEVTKMMLWLSPRYGDSEISFCIERQVPGMRNGAWMCVAMMAVLCPIYKHFPGAMILLPYPTQLKSYIKQNGIDAESKSDIVEAYRDLFPETEGKISSHKVEAYFLTSLAADVKKGDFVLNPPEKDVFNLLPLKEENV